MASLSPFQQQHETSKTFNTQNPLTYAWKRNVSALVCTILLSVFIPITLWPKQKAAQQSVPMHHEAKQEIAMEEITEVQELHELIADTTPPPEVPAPLPVPLPPKAEHDRSIGVYLTANSIARGDGFLDRTMREISLLPHPALVIDVKENGVLFESHAALANELEVVKNKYNLADIVRSARQNGIHTIARFVAVKDRPLATKRADTHIRHPETDRSVGSVWIDPANAFVLEYNRQILEEVVAAGVDEVNIDYIRYPTEYDQVWIGLTGRQKAARVEKFVEMARTVIDEVNPQTKLGISTYAILGHDYRTNADLLGQDVARFAPLVDIISPMAYPASFAQSFYYNSVVGKSRMYSLVYRTLEGYNTVLGEEHRNKIRPWIQGYRVSNIDISDQIQAVYDSGACGFMVWNPSNLYGPLHNVMPEFAIPEHCRE